MNIAIIIVAILLVVRGIIKIIHITQYNHKSFIIEDLVGLAIDILLIIFLFKYMNVLISIFG